jgi:hypothetical protein
LAVEEAQKQCSKVQKGSRQRNGRGCAPHPRRGRGCREQLAARGPALREKA